MPAPRLLSMHAAPCIRSPASPSGCALRGGRSGFRKPASMARLFSHVCRAAHLSPAPSLWAAPCGAAGAASRDPASMAARLFSHARAPPPLHACRAAHPLFPASPSGCALQGGRIGLPQSRFCGAPPLSPASLWTAPYRAAGAASAIPLPWRASSPLHARAAHLSPASPSGCALRSGRIGLPQSRFCGAPPLFPASPSDCALQGGRSGLRDPVPTARFPSLACRAAHPFSHASPSDCALRGSRSGLPQARFHGALPLPCTSAPRTRSSLHCPFGLCLAKRQERPPASPLPWHASAPLHAAPRTSPPASPSGCALQGGRSGLRKPASMARLPPMHAAPRTRSSRGTPCPGRFAAPVRKLLFQAAPAGKSGLRVHSVQIQSLRIQQIA